MPAYSIIAQIFARDPRKLAQFPDAPLDRALDEFAAIQKELDSFDANADAARARTAAAESAENFLSPLASIVTNVWRAKSKMIDSTGQPREEMKRVFRHIESTFEAFNQAGLIIQDLADQPYDAGLPVKVLAFQPTPELSRDTIIEVVRPTIIWRDKLLQMGEVIVGIPESSQSTLP